MAMKVSKALALLWFLHFCCPCFAMEQENEMSEKYIHYFSLENIKNIVKNNEKILRAAFPEDASSGWYYKEEDPVELFNNYSPLKSYDLLFQKIFHDTNARQIFPLKQLWLKNHRQLHQLILQTAIKTTIENIKPNEAQVKNWVLDYITFFFEPVANESTTNRSMSAHNVCHYSHLSDKCPEWLRPELEKWTSAYQALYQRLEKARLRLDYCIKQEYVPQVAYKLIREHGYYVLQELVTEIVDIFPHKSPKKSHIKYLINFIINELSKHYNLSDIKHQNYKQILIDSSLALELRDKTSFYIIKACNSYAPWAKKEYIIDETLLRKLMSDWMHSKT